MRYKVHPAVANLSMRLTIYWFTLSTLMISICLGDMAKLFNPHEYWYPSQPAESPEQFARYETLYNVERTPVL